MVDKKKKKMLPCRRHIGRVKNKSDTIYFSLLLRGMKTDNKWRGWSSPPSKVIIVLLDVKLTAVGGAFMWGVPWGG